MKTKFTLAVLLMVGLLGVSGEVFGETESSGTASASSATTADTVNVTINLNNIPPVLFTYKSAGDTTTKTATNGTSIAVDPTKTLTITPPGSGPDAIISSYRLKEGEVFTLTTQRKAVKWVTQTIVKNKAGNRIYQSPTS